MKIKKWIRKKYIYWKYKHNWNTGKLIVLKEDDRNLGLTTMMMKDCLEKGCVLLVNGNPAKKYMAHEIYMRGQLGFLPPITEQEAYQNYVLSLNDIKKDKHKARKLKLIVDNSCHDFDLDTLYYASSYIVNGFVYSNIAA